MSAPAVEDFLRAYPAAIADCMTQARRAWDDLSDLDRAAAIAGVEPYLAARSALCFRTVPTGPRYLRGRLWEGLK